MAVTLRADKEYWWCACGRSKNQPFCDGSHQGTGFSPVSFKPEQPGEAWLCMCKHTGTPPYCDGTHKRLDVLLQKEELSSPEQVRPTDEEPTLPRVHALAREGLEASKLSAMGVPRPLLPRWEDIQLLTAQLDRPPLPDNAGVDTRLVIGPNARKPLELEIPLFVSDMSFGSLSREAKIALARGAEMAGTGICSGEGGMLPEEQQANSRYFYELAPAMYGYEETLLPLVQAFHFKAGQGAKTGIGGHLPGSKVTEEIARVRGLRPGEDAVSPPAFENLRSPEQFRRFAERVRALTGGIPIGMKLSANHIERDIDFALAAGVDYIILDGRGGGTGAAPAILRDNISVPTIPALARARRHLDHRGASGVTLIITGGLRVPEDFVKALALGADGIAIASSALQAIGCIASRICHTNNCPTGIATQDPQLRQRLNVEESARRLQRFLMGSVELMKLFARACGHDRLCQFDTDDLTTWKQPMATLAGIPYAGDSADPSGS